jgi:two-component sensor histidine kinase
MQAVSHPRQSERLATLRAYNILDTERESDFDDIVALASQLCGTPISVVNLIDSDRQWFKAEVGLGVRETPIATSICAHAILQDDLVEIEDTLIDQRLADNPLVTGTPGLRFYAGVLLVAEDGLPLGTLCVLDYKPRKLNDLQRNALRVLGRQVMTQMELRRALRTADLLRQEVDHRVKNSLQLLYSLTSLQGRAAPDASTRSALETVRNRISSIAGLHDLLHKTDASGEVDLSIYLPQVLDAVRPSLPAGVTLTAQIARVTAPSRVATSLALALNELVTNSAKHAFPDPAEPGSISVTLSEPVGGGLTLDYRDNGVGLAADASTSGLGMRVIDSLATSVAARVETGHAVKGYALRMTLGATPAPAA